MSPIRNATVLYAKTPEGAWTSLITKDDVYYTDDTTIDLDTAPLEGGFVAKTVTLGVDLWQRMKMTFYPPGGPLLGYGVGRVVRSENAKYKVGDYIYAANYPFQEYASFPAKAIAMDSDLRVIDNSAGLPWHNYVSVLGMVGQTAYVGYKALAKAKKGETIYVSVGAGTVGSIVCQLAKAEGLRVIASAGSDEKVQYLLKDLGVNAAFNYKTRTIDDALKEYGPVDIYWDHVCGEALETVLNHMNDFGRVVIAGVLSSYGGPQPIKNIHLILAKNLTVSGFVINKLIGHVGDFDFMSNMTKLVVDGKVKVVETISEDLSDAPKLLNDFLAMKHTGKPVINLSKE